MIALHWYGLFDHVLSSKLNWLSSLIMKYTEESHTIYIDNLRRINTCVCINPDGPVISSLSPDRPYLHPLMYTRKFVSC